MPILPFIQAVAPIVGSMLTNRANKRENDSARLYNYQMYQRDLEYNSPKAQMQRLKEAGLNPFSVYGSGNVTGNASRSIPEAYPTRFENPIDNLPIMETLGQYANIKKLNAETDQTLKHTELLETQRQTELLNQRLLSQDLISKKFDYGQKSRLADTSYEYAVNDLKRLGLDNEQKMFDLYKTNPAKLRAILTDIEQKNLSMNKTDWEIKNLKFRYEKMLPIEFDKLSAETYKKLPEEIKNIKVQTMLNTYNMLNESNKYNVNKELVPFNMDSTKSYFWILYARMINSLNSGTSKAKKSVKDFFNYIDNPKNFTK